MGTDEGITIRRATVVDADIIFEFILGLAKYEKKPEAVVTTPDVIAKQLEEVHPPFECLIADLDTEPAGFALFFHNYSTWTGRRGLYLEDLFVWDRHRGKGVGKALFLAVAQIANRRGCARFEWAALDWNEPAVDFYKTFGAEALDEWTTFRLSGHALTKMDELG